MSTPAPDAFAVQRAAVADDLELAYVRAGDGGYPLVLIHGYPETMRIWWRNIEPLAAAGFDVIVPDLRGFGASDVAPDGHYDPAAFATDLYVLVHDVLGLDQCVTAAGDLGGVVLIDLGLRFPGFVTRQVFFNSIPPYLNEAYTAAGIPSDLERVGRATADYFIRQGTDADALCAELDTPERRRAYIADFYGHRLWARPDAFTPDDVDFMTEPFADGGHLRAAMGCYEVSFGNRPLSEPPRLFETIPIPTVVLYGPDDHVIPDTFTAKCAVAFEECVGPFVVEGAGHFVPWEQPGVFNRTVRWFCADLLAAR